MAKSTYLYTTDGGTQVKVVLDSAKAVLGGFVAPAANDTSIVVPGFGKRMRGIYLEGPSGSNYFMPCATQDVAIYSADSSTTVTYKGTQLQSISRKGESIYYGPGTAEGEAPLATTP